ncbi:hypothetical protein DRP44_00855 [candidate division TA06 bacterium]|uniref:Lipopolysaccharide assembly protein A domain-containing protein n=1 Tax=candidate division TA06 bacterium TaxID=2250710 RepID=A0A660SDB3_UNCT6|nr:MAG: hypothetical protein DRP44_00855 [candidate division TA06 bacterium]
MGIFTIIVLVIFVVIGAIVGIENNSIFISFKFFNQTYNTVPLFLILLYSFLAGLVFMLIIKIGDEIRFRRRIRSLEKKIREMKTELDEIRKLPIKGRDETEEEEES